MIVLNEKSIKLKHYNKNLFQKNLLDNLLGYNGHEAIRVSKSRPILIFLFIYGIWTISHMI